MVKNLTEAATKAKATVVVDIPATGTLRKDFIGFIHQHFEILQKDGLNEPTSWVRISQLVYVFNKYKKPETPTLELSCAIYTIMFGIPSAVFGPHVTVLMKPYTEEEVIRKCHAQAKAMAAKASKATASGGNASSSAAPKEKEITVGICSSCFAVSPLGAGGSTISADIDMESLGDKKKFNEMFLKRMRKMFIDKGMLGVGDKNGNKVGSSLDQECLKQKRLDKAFEAVPSNWIREIFSHPQHLPELICSAIKESEFLKNRPVPAGNPKLRALFAPIKKSEEKKPEKVGVRFDVVECTCNACIAAEFLWWSGTDEPSQTQLLISHARQMVKESLVQELGLEKKMSPSQQQKEFEAFYLFCKHEITGVCGKKESYGDEDIKRVARLWSDLPPEIRKKYFLVDGVEEKKKNLEVFECKKMGKESS